MSNEPSTEILFMVIIHVKTGSVTGILCFYKEQK